jgi:hypothetical protein
VVTETAPVDPVSTMAETVVGEMTVNELAGVPPKLTAVVPRKLLPEIIMVLPAFAEAGLKEDIEGAIKLNPTSVPVPSGPVTETWPLAPVPTVAIIVVVDTTVNEVAGVPPKLTAVAPVKLLPVIVTTVPSIPLEGVKEEMTGGGRNIKPAKWVVPPGVVMLTFPVAPPPTTANIVVGERTVKEVAATPPKLTAVAPVRSIPLIVIDAPLPAEAGENEAIAGGGAKEKPDSASVSCGVVSVTSPDAPAPTTAVIVVELKIVKEAAATPPKRTPVTPPKLVPVMVTVCPAAAVVGEKEVIAGSVILFLKTETHSVVKLAAAMSGMPSPSRSPSAALYGERE